MPRTSVQEPVDRAALGPEGAAPRPQRSIITQAVQGADFTATATMLTPRAGDRYLLCSDGLSDYVTDEDIKQALLSCPAPQPCAESLVRLALQAGAAGNGTVIVSDVAVAETAGRRGPADLGPGWTRGPPRPSPL